MYILAVGINMLLKNYIIYGFIRVIVKQYGGKIIEERVLYPISTIHVNLKNNQKMENFNE